MIPVVSLFVICRPLWVPAPEFAFIVHKAKYLLLASFFAAISPEKVAYASEEAVRIQYVNAFPAGNTTSSAICPNDEDVPTSIFNHVIACVWVLPIVIVLPMVDAADELLTVNASIAHVAPLVTSAVPVDVASNVSHTPDDHVIEDPQDRPAAAIQLNTPASVLDNTYPVTAA